MQKKPNIKWPAVQILRVGAHGADLHMENLQQITVSAMWMEFYKSHAHDLVRYLPLVSSMSIYAVDFPRWLQWGKPRSATNPQWKFMVVDFAADFFYLFLLQFT